MKSNIIPILVGTDNKTLEIEITYAGDFEYRTCFIIKCTDRDSYNEQLGNILRQDESFSIFHRLKNWREERNIEGYDHKLHVRCIIEELFELMHYTDKEIKNKVEEFMKIHYFKPTVLDMDTVIDASCDMNVFNINFVEQAGYDGKKAMEETIAEIESRKGAMNSKTGKWEKFTNEKHKKLWYKADYDKCINKQKGF